MLFVARIPKHSTRGLVLWSFLNAVWFMFYEGPQHTTAEMSEHAHMIVYVWNNMATVEHISFHLSANDLDNVTTQPGKRRLCCVGPWFLFRVHVMGHGRTSNSPARFFSNNLATWCEGVKCGRKQVFLSSVWDQTQSQTRNVQFDT